ncbi:MAG: trehalose-6-phosphate synthase [Acidisphaera sp.]|nr:trehalose-6-phosphate synthase [Acidisphaera sp.]
MNRLVVVSNRVPVPSAAGAQAGGLAVALDGLMEKRGGLWFGWSGRISETARETPVEIATHGNVVYATVDLTGEEHSRYYNNFCNGLLWPLLHTMPELMSFDRRDAQAYREVNARLADALVPLLKPTDLLWVHDYHLLALPAMLRARGVRNAVGFFLHIPFATAGVIAAAPEVGGLVRDMLAADLIGFQTENDLENFAATAQPFAGMAPAGTALAGAPLAGAAPAGAAPAGSGWTQLSSRRARLGVFPVEIEPREFAATADAAWRSPATERLRRSLSEQSLILGVDRLDPTKGLLQRLGGLRRLFEKRPEWRRRVTLLQIAAVSRKEVASYRELRAALDREAGGVNSDWGDPDWTPVRLVAKAGARSVIAGYMRQAKVGLVTPLRDGMNLVAKEFVAAQDPQDPGVLVLSRFAGAARQLEDALLVNPHDTDEMADAIHTALRMPLGERQARWQGMWNSLRRASPESWGRTFLAALLHAAAPARTTTNRPRWPAPVSEIPAPSLQVPQRMRSEIEAARSPIGDPRHLI